MASITLMVPLMVVNLYVNSHMWYQKCSLPCINFLGFLVCIVTSKIIGIGAYDSSWVGIKIIKFGKGSYISSDVSEKYIIVYTSACIETAKI